MLIFKKIGILEALWELLEPHLFGRTGDLKFGTVGVDLFVNVLLYQGLFIFAKYVTRPFTSYKQGKTRKEILMTH